MTTLIILCVIALLVWLLRAQVFGFAAQRPAQYAETSPAFDIRDHLSGKLLCDGVIYGPLGRVDSRFVAKMEGVWTGETGTLDEYFSYSSGSTQARQWRLTMGENSKFTATADDIIGMAQGEQCGATVRMSYRIRLPRDAGGHVLAVTDWMYLLENGVIMNRSVMRKFGIKVAELVATMRPDAA